MRVISVINFLIQKTQLKTIFQLIQFIKQFTVIASSMSIQVDVFMRLPPKASQQLSNSQLSTTERIFLMLGFMGKTKSFPLCLIFFYGIAFTMIKFLMSFRVLTKVFRLTSFTLSSIHQGKK